MCWSWVVWSVTEKQSCLETFRNTNVVCPHCPTRSCNATHSMTVLIPSTSYSHLLHASPTCRHPPRLSTVSSRLPGWQAATQPSRCGRRTDGTQLRAVLALHFSSMISCQRQVATDYVVGSVRPSVCVIDFCQLNILKTNLWIRAKFIADTPLLYYAGND